MARQASSISLVNLLILCGAMYCGGLLRDNPLLLGKSVGQDKLQSAKEVFTIYTSHPILDVVLKKHETTIGADYEAYRNHCLRVLTFAASYYHTKYYPDVKVIPEHSLNILALGIAYHDIALWTDGELNYLEPSVAQMEKDMQNKPESDPLPSFSPQDLDTVRDIILQHHRFRHWRPTETTANKVLVNIVRSGDWADATMGLIKSGMPPAYLEATYIALPVAGFHKRMAGMGGRLSADSYLGRLSALKILKW